MTSTELVKTDKAQGLVLNPPGIKGKSHDGTATMVTEP